MKDYKQIIIMEPGRAEFRDDPLTLLEDAYGKLRPETVPLEADEIAGNTLFSLLSPGTEMNFYLGNYRNSPIPMRYPRYTGYACSFQVEKVGSAVTDVKPGDLCFCRGPHATIQRLRRCDAIRLPEGMDPRRAPFAKFACVPMSTLADCAAMPPALVMVIGQGIIGVMAAQVFQRCGYEVIAVEPIEGRRELARQCGIRNVFADVPVDDPRYAGKVSLVLECSGSEAAVMAGTRMVRRFGEIVLVAAHMVPTGDYQMNDLLKTIFRNNVVLKGGSEWRVPLHEPDFSARTHTQMGNDVPAIYQVPYSFENSYELNLNAALRWLAEGSLVADPLYQVLDPRDCTEVYDRVSKRQYSTQSIIFDWAGVD